MATATSKTAAPLSRSKARTLAGIGMMLIIATLAWACAPRQTLDSQTAPQAAASPDPARQWLGRDVGDLEKQLGTPTNVITLQGNRRGGGKIILYANPGQAHMVFETAPGSQTINKALTVE